MVVKYEPSRDVNDSSPNSEGLTGMGGLDRQIHLRNRSKNSLTNWDLGSIKGDRHGSKFFEIIFIFFFEKLAKSHVGANYYHPT